MVDLGLPSGTLWATMNVGASDETGSGTYFQCGDPDGYTNENDYGIFPLSWNTYKYGKRLALFKYNVMDGKKVLDSEDDAATQNWGGNWRMPTKAEFMELLSTVPSTAQLGTGALSANYTWTKYNGTTTKYKGSSIAGWEIKNNTTEKAIFIPIAGILADNKNIGNRLALWSSQMVTEDDAIYSVSGFTDYYNAWSYEIQTTNHWVKEYYGRQVGIPVRAVVKQ